MIPIKPSTFKKFKYRINGFLKNDISINDIYKVKEDAHARFSAISRTYEYCESPEHKNPFSVNSYFLTRDLDVESMKKACKFLHGSHDYTSFAKLHSENYTNNCEVYIANWKEDENLLIFTIKANRFLRNMVRAIVGTLIEVGEGKISFSDIETILMSKDRAKAGYSVPANGLSLVDVEYPKDIHNMKETKTGQVLDTSLLFRVVRYARPYKKQFIIAATAAIILSFLGPARPMLINYAIDNFIIIADPQKLIENNNPTHCSIVLGRLHTVFLHISIDLDWTKCNLRFKKKNI